MKKILFRLFFSTLFSILFISITMLYQVNASSTDELPNIDFESTIMKYDARTGETTKVDLRELQEVVANMNIVSENGTYCIEGSSPQSSPFIYVPNLIPFPSMSINSLVELTTSAERIINPTVPPYSKVAKVIAYDNTGETMHGTAAIVGPRVALTSAHCIFDEDNNNAIFSNWTCYPGYNNGAFNNYSSGWATVYYDQTWKNTHNDEYDWCICLLEQNFSSAVGWFGVQSYGSNSELNNTYVNVLGYPGDSNYGYWPDARYQYVTGKQISSVSDRHFLYSGYTVGGFSGGPIIRSDNKIVGVHKGSTNWGGTPYGVRITQNMINIIAALHQYT